MSTEGEVKEIEDGEDGAASPVDEVKEKSKDAPKSPG